MRSLYEKYKIKRSRANERALCWGGSAVGVFRDQRERETGRIRRDSGIKGREPSEHPGKRPECGSFGRMALGARLRNHGLKTTHSEDFFRVHRFRRSPGQLVSVANAAERAGAGAGNRFRLKKPDF